MLLLRGVHGHHYTLPMGERTHDRPAAEQARVQLDEELHLQIEAAQLRDQLKEAKKSVADEFRALDLSCVRTLVNAADALLDHGAREVYAYITHGVLSGTAIERVNGSALKELVITDSIQPTAAALASSKVRVLSIAPLVGEAIHRIAEESSVSSLWD